MIAEINPIIGGKSEAFAIPKLKGKANKNTIKPEIASVLKFSFKGLLNYLKSYELVYLYNTYFKQISNKMLVIK